MNIPPYFLRRTGSMYTLRRITSPSLFLVIVLASTYSVLGGEHCCARCGCASKCTKVCRLVCEEKEISVTCWGCKDEDFCIGKPSCPDCDHCETACQPDCKDGVCSAPTKFVWTNWIPGSCARMFTKHKLMKKTVKKKVPSFKWVVEDLCKPCEMEVAEVKKAEKEKSSVEKEKSADASQPKPAEIQK